MKFFLTTTILIGSFCLSFGQFSVRVTSYPGADASSMMASTSSEFRTNADGSRTINILDKKNVKIQSNSKTTADGSTIVEANISWDDLLGAKADNPSIQKNVYVLDADFFIPQLKRNRKVWVYLPPDYETSSKKYPVIYMQDGQNLFNEQGSVNGEWKVDETMNSLFNQGDYGAIIVAIENGGWRRLDEYSPWYNDQLEAGGEGRQYGDFLVKTLKPYVDATYRTLPAREYTGLIGSSMGGLITHYVALENQEVFSKVGVLSPSFWFASESFSHTASLSKKAPIKYYTIAGQLEGNEMVDGVNKMVDVLTKMGFKSSNIKKNIHTDGKHEESYWAREFGNAYKWLFGDLNLKNADLTVKTLNDIVAKSNADFSQLWIENFKNVEGAEAQIISEDGRFVRKFSLEGSDSIDISSIQNGTHTINISLQNRIIYTDKISIKRN